MQLWEINSYQRQENEREEETELEENDRGSNSTRQLNGRQKKSNSKQQKEDGGEKKVMMAHLMSASVTEMTRKFRDWRCHGNRFLCC